MSRRTGGQQDPLARLSARFERLDRALDEALTGRNFKRRRRKRKPPVLRPTDTAQAIKRATSLILTALHASLLEDPDNFGALTYYQLKTRKLKRVA
jgi:hypothetical protein